MKKALLVVASILIAFSVGCKKGEKKPEAPAVLAKKYAKYPIAVKEDKNLEKWKATLAKAESVELMKIEDVVIKGNKTVRVAEVKLSDDTVGYLEEKHLADTPVVFTADTKIHTRNNKTSRVYMTIPSGTLAFVIAEKADWIQIYAGKVKGKWVTKHWVNEGFSTDENLVIQARAYGEAVETLKKDDAKEGDKEKALSNLKDLQGEQSIFAELATKAIEDYTNNAVEDVEEAPEKSETAEKTEENKK